MCIGYLGNIVIFYFAVEPNQAVNNDSIVITACPIIIFMHKSGGKMSCLTCKSSYYAILICVSMICITASVPMSEKDYSGSSIDSNIDEHHSKATEFTKMV